MKIAVPVLIVITPPYHESNERPIERLCFNPLNGDVGCHGCYRVNHELCIWKKGEINVSCDDSCASYDEDSAFIMLRAFSLLYHRLWRESNGSDDKNKRVQPFLMVDLSSRRK